MNENLVARSLRYLTEVDPLDPTPKPTPPAENEPDFAPEAEPEVGDEAAKIEIYFSNLDAATQKAVMEALLQAAQATVDDTMARQKIEKQLSEKPMFVVMGMDLKRQLNINL